jgi:hypothetical protein
MNGRFEVPLVIPTVTTLVYKAFNEVGTSEALEKGLPSLESIDVKLNSWPEFSHWFLSRIRSWTFSDYGTVVWLYTFPDIKPAELVQGGRFAEITDKGWTEFCDVAKGCTRLKTGTMSSRYLAFGLPPHVKHIVFDKLNMSIPRDKIGQVHQMLVDHGCTVEIEKLETYVIYPYEYRSSQEYEEDFKRNEEETELWKEIAVKFGQFDEA